jgi:cytochrome c biogenesis protein CcdA
MAVEALLPTVGVIVVTGLIDAINPCTIGVLILLLSILLGSEKSVKSFIVLGGFYILAVFLTYLIAGLGLIYFFAAIPIKIAEYLSLGIGSIIIAAGIIEIKDYFWYGKGFTLSIPKVFSKKLERYATRATIPGVMFLGVFVSAVELPCTGAPYLAIITLLSQVFDYTALALLILYNLIFISPLVVILLLVAGGKKLQGIKKWKLKNRPYMRLGIGIVLVAMGWLLILIANGTINLG